MAVELVSAPNPHHIPGYTGFCPQYRYRLGDTYGTTTHKLLLDPSVSHAEKLVISDRVADDFQVQRPPLRDIDIVDARIVHCDPLYKNPTIPGYQGFVPQVNSLFGQKYTVQADEALGELERMQKSDTLALQQLLRKGSPPGTKWSPNLSGEEQLTASEFKFPLLQVRPECAGVARNLPVDEPPCSPPDHSSSPYFQASGDPSKNGFSGPCPFGSASFGQNNEPMTRSALCDFTANYRKRLSTEWAPVSVNRPDPPLLIQPSEIYHRHVGQVPNYCGHIPGAIFRYGKTYGNDTRDAKRWLRGDFA